MQLNGKILHILPIQSGTSKKGDWQKRDIVIETDGEYPKKVSVSIWNKLLDIKLSEGQKITADIDINAKEYNGKWYNEVKAWKIDVTNSKKNVTEKSTIIEELETELPF
jgi:hypothetical protein